MQRLLTSIAHTVTAREQRPVYAVFAVSLLVNLAHHAFMRANDPFFDYLLAGGDNHNYHRWAGEIAQTFWLGWGRVPFEQGPLYPYFLAFIFLRFGIGYGVATLAQAVLGAVNVALLFGIARMVFGVATAWTAAAIATVCANLLLYQTELLPETLVVTVNLACIRSLLIAGRRRTGWSALRAGLWLGICAIARPNALLLTPLAVLWVWWRSRPGSGAYARAGVALLGTILAVAPVTITNIVAGGEFALVTRNPSWNLYIGNAPDSTGTYQRPQTMWYIIGITQKNESDIRWGPVFWRFFRNDPSFLPRILAKKTVLFWQSGEIPQIENFYLKRAFSPLLRSPLRFGIIAPAGLVGMVMALWRVRAKRTSSEPVLLTAYVLVFSVSIIIAFVIARLRLPVLAVLIVFAAYALTVTVSYIRERKVFRAVALVGATTVLALALRTPNDKFLFRWSDYYNLGSAYEARGDLLRARESYDAALRLNPESFSAKSAKNNVEKLMAITPDSDEAR